MIRKVRMAEADPQTADALVRASKSIVTGGVSALASLTEDSIREGICISSLAVTLLRANVVYLTLFDEAATADLLETIAANVRAGRGCDISNEMHAAISNLAAAEICERAKFEAGGQA